MTTSEATKERVIIKYLVNRKASQIAKEESISEATVYNIMSEFYSQFGRGSTRTRLLVEAMRRSNLSVAHHAAAVRLLHILRKFAEPDEEGQPPKAAKFEKAIDLFEDWCNECTTELESPERILNYRKEIQDSCALFGVSSPEELLETARSVNRIMEEMSETRDALALENERLKQEKEILVQQRNEELRKSRVIFENISNYAKTKARLAQSVKHDDIDATIVSVAECIDGLKAEGLDIGTLIPMLKHREQMRRDEEAEVQEYFRRAQLRQLLDKRFQDDLDAKGDKVAILRKWEEQGIDIREGERLLDMLQKFAEARGRSIHDLMRDLTAGLKEQLIGQPTQEKNGAVARTITANRVVEHKQAHGNKPAATMTTAATTTVRTTPAATVCPAPEEADTRITVPIPITAKGGGTDASTTSCATITTTTTTIDTPGHGSLEPSNGTLSTVSAGIYGPTDNPYMAGTKPIQINGDVITMPDAVKENTRIIGSGCCYYHDSDGKGAAHQ